MAARWTFRRWLRLNFFCSICFFHLQGASVQAFYLSDEILMCYQMTIYTNLRSMRICHAGLQKNFFFFGVFFLILDLSPGFVWPSLVAKVVVVEGSLILKRGCIFICNLLLPYCLCVMWPVLCLLHSWTLPQLFCAGIKSGFYFSLIIQVWDLYSDYDLVDHEDSLGNYLINLCVGGALCLLSLHETRVKFSAFWMEMLNLRLPFPGMAIALV